jgi:hypothetical protein
VPISGEASGQNDPDVAEPKHCNFSSFYLPVVGETGVLIKLTLTLYCGTARIQGLGKQALRSEPLPSYTRALSALRGPRVLFLRSQR